MNIGGGFIVEKHKFEEDLVKTKELKADNQMIIIDDRALTLSSIDLHLGKLKAKFGEKLTVCVIDYLNQIVVEGSGQFDWQPQVLSGLLITPFSTRSMSQFRWNGYQFHNPCHWAEFRNCHISASNWEKRSDNECPDGQHPAKLLQTTIRLRGCEQNKITNYEPDRSWDETKKEAHWPLPLITI